MGVCDGGAGGGSPKIGVSEGWRDIISCQIWYQAMQLSPVFLFFFLFSLRSIKLSAVTCTSYQSFSLSLPARCEAVHDGVRVGCMGDGARFFCFGIIYKSIHPSTNNPYIHPSIGPGIIGRAPSAGEVTWICCLAKQIGPGEEKGIKKGKKPFDPVALVFFFAFLPLPPRPLPSYQTFSPLEVAASTRVAWKWYGNAALSKHRFEYSQSRVVGFPSLNDEYRLPPDISSRSAGLAVSCCHCGAFKCSFFGSQGTGPLSGPLHCARGVVHPGQVAAQSQGVDTGLKKNVLITNPKSFKRITRNNAWMLVICDAAWLPHVKRDGLVLSKSVRIRKCRQMWLDEDHNKYSQLLQGGRISISVIFKVMLS